MSDRRSRTRLSGALAACGLLFARAPSRAVGAELGGPQSPARGLAGAPAALRDGFAAAVSRLAATLPPDDAAGLAEGLRRGLGPESSAADVAAARAVLAALADRSDEARLLGELRATREPQGEHAAAALAAWLDQAAPAAREAALAARAQPGALDRAFDGLGARGAGGEAVDAGASGSVAAVSGLQPAPRRAFANETAEQPFAEMVDGLLEDEEARRIARDLFTDLTEQPARPFAGRSRAAAEMLGVLSRDFGEKRSVRLVGPLGSGRKTLIDHVAAGIGAGTYDLDLKVLELDLPRLARLYSSPASAAGRPAPFDLFLDEILPAFAGRSVIVVRGAERLLEGEAAKVLQLLERPMERTGQRFVFVLESEEKLPAGHFLRKLTERVTLAPLDGRAATQLLLAHKGELERASGVKILDAAIEELVSSSRDFLHRLHPQELVDNLVRALAGRTERSRANEGQAAVGDLFSQLSLALAKSRRTGDVRDRNEAVRLARALDAEQQALASPRALELDAEHVKDALARQYPEKENLIRGNKSFKKRLLEAIPRLKERMVGQDEAVRAVVDVLETVAMGLDDEKGTLGSFLFLGPTGVGKTEIAKALAEAYSGSEKSLIRLDMSEYMDKHNVSRMTGPPPGYAGYDEGGALTNAVDKDPETVVLYDEVEKAHMDVYNVLLQVFDDGRLTDGKGKTIDFRRTINIMTSNLASDLIVKMVAAGASPEEIGAAVRQALIDGQMVEGRLVRFKPEFLNRLSAVVVFTPLGRPMVIKIGELQTKATVAKPLERNGHELLPLGEGVLDYVADHGGFDPAMGARPMVRAIRSTIKEAVKQHLKEKSDSADEPRLKVRVALEDSPAGQRIVVTSEPKVEPPPTAEPLPEGKLGGWLSRALSPEADASAEALEASYYSDVRPRAALAASPRPPRPAAPKPVRPVARPAAQRPAPAPAEREPVSSFDDFVDELGLPSLGRRR